MRSWKFWLGLIISAVFLVLALRGLNLEDFWRTLRTANYWWLLPAVAVYSIAVLGRTWRWQLMLTHMQLVPLRRLFPVVVIGYMGNNVYPARAGELLRSYVLRRNEGVAMSASLATVVLERIFDGLTLLVFIFLTLPLAPLPPVYQTLVESLGLLFGVALLLFFALVMRPARLSRLYSWVVEHWTPARLRPHVHGLFDRFVIGLQSLRSPRELFWIAVASLAIWLIETATYWLVMQAFALQAPFLVLMLMTGVINLFTSIPSTPGYIGTFHAPGIAVLVSFGIAQALATGYTVVLHVTLWLPITLLGAFFMVRQSLSWGDIDRAARSTPPGVAPPVAAAEPEGDDVASRVTP